MAGAACGDSVGVSDDSYDIEFDFSNDYQGWVAGSSPTIP